MEKLKHIWSDLNELAGDLSKPYPTVGSWMQRGIPPKHFGALIRAAKLRGVELTLDQLEAVNSDIQSPKGSDQKQGAEDAA